MRRGWGILIIAALAVAAFWGTWAFLRSPHYAIYQIGKAIYQRDAQLFLAYVDVDHILLNQSGDVAALLVPELKEQNQKTMIKQMVGVIMGALKNQIKDRVAKAVADPKRENLPSSWTLLAGANITSKDHFALVVLSEPEKGRRLRMGMRRDQEMGQLAGGAAKCQGCQGVAD